MWARGRTLALIGASGVGKSALVNALAGEERLEVGSVRNVDAKGRHTTTARELVLLPNEAGLVLDTPGIRSVGLWEAEHALDLVFGDLEELSGGCRFHDCVHGSEPGCAISAAVTDGTLDAKRVERLCRSRCRVGTTAPTRTTAFLSSAPITGGGAPRVAQWASVADVVSPSFEFGECSAVDFVTGVSRQLSDDPDVFGEFVGREFNRTKVAQVLQGGRLMGVGHHEPLPRRISPITSSGLPTTAISAMAGWLPRTDSTSIG